MDNETSPSKMDHCRCLSCNEIRECSRFICPSCVNDGRFSLPSHRLCTRERFEELIGLLNEKDSIEFEGLIKNKKLHQTEIQCFYAMFILKKIRLEKESLRNQFQLKRNSCFPMNLMIEEIVSRKKRIIHVREQLSDLRKSIGKRSSEKLELDKKKEKLDLLIRDRQRPVGPHIPNLKEKLHDIKRLKESYDKKLIEKMKILEHVQNQLRRARRRCFRELQIYICPIELVSTIGGDLARRIRDLSDIWDDNDNKNQGDNNVVSIELEKKTYRIVNSFLSFEDHENAIDNLVTIYHSAESDEEVSNLTTMDSFVLVNDLDSPQLSPSIEAFESLSALSHACLLTNAIAYILDMPLPFHIHQIEFHKSELTAPDLRANVAKLNANITSICLRQNIPVEKKEKHTLENLHNILQLITRSPIRSESYTFSPTFVTYLESVITDVDGALQNEYWFDRFLLGKGGNEDNSDVQSSLDNTRMTSDSNQHNNTDATMTNSDQLQTSVMSDSTGYMKKTSDYVFSLFGGGRRS